MIRFLMRNKTSILWLTLLVYVLHQTSLSNEDPEEFRTGRASVRVEQRMDEPHMYFHGVPADDDVHDDVAASSETSQRDKRRQLSAQAAAHAQRSKPEPEIRKEEEEEEEEEESRKTHKEGPRLKRILYWTKYFRAKHFQFGFGQWPFIHYKCPVDTCTATNDKSTLLDADVIVFHGPLTKKLPEVRLRNQIYVFVQKEPWLERSNKTLVAFNDVINLTMTYRADSDIVLPYGYVYRNHSAAIRRHPFVDPVAKRRSVAWPVSHCQTESRREVYAKELAKYIDVDVYGDCGDHVCPKDRNPECWEMFEREYRFLLAFENQACKDYVTEKAFRPLAHNIVPIVYGGADYDQLLPKHSFIDVRRYPDPKDLAKHLRYLTRNRTAYDEYFRWKDGGFEVETYKEALMAKAFCKLCAIAHNKHYKYRRYQDLRKWWVDGACSNNLLAKFKASWSRP